MVTGIKGMAPVWVWRPCAPINTGGSFGSRLLKGSDFFWIAFRRFEALRDCRPAWTMGRAGLNIDAELNYTLGNEANHSALVRPP